MGTYDLFQTMHHTNTDHDLSMLAEPGLLDDMPEHEQQGEAEQPSAQQGK